MTVPPLLPDGSPDRVGLEAMLATMTVAQIAEACSVAPSTVYRWMRAVDLRSPRRREPTDAARSPVSVWLSPAELQLLDEAAEAAGVPRAELMRDRVLGPWG